MAEEETVEKEVETQEAVETPETAEDPGVKSALSDIEDKPVAAPADWPEDWRDKFADGDEKELKRLGRFKSPVDIMKSYRAMETKLSSGDLKAGLAADASEDEVAAYRKDNGIPEAPDGYLESLPDGLVVGEDDKAMADSFLERVHAKNAPPEFVNEALSWYQDLKETEASQRSEADEQARVNSTDELRGEWGGQYTPTMNSIKAMLQSGPTQEDGTFDELVMQSRTADGTPFASHPDVLRWLADQSKLANPAGFITPAAGKTQAQSIQDEMAEIEKVMRTNRSAYNKDQKMQARYLELAGAQEKLSQSAA